MNKVCLIGRLTKDPELRESEIYNKPQNVVNKIIEYITDKIGYRL